MIYSVCAESTVKHQ